MSPAQQVPPQSPENGSGISTRTTVVVLGASLAVLIGLAALLAVPAAGSRGADGAPRMTASATRLEPISSPGEHPFMAPVGTDRPAVTAPANTAGKFSGATPGLFGDNGDQTSCDPRAMVANLRGDQQRASAWSAALGVTSGDVGTFVDSLTPVVLRSDTAVTVHGYDNGVNLPYPGVLQAGTSVFVDTYGEPTVKCFSGNPLTAPRSTQEAYVGPAWTTFRPAAVTVITPAPAAIKDYTFVHVRYGRQIRAAGKPEWPRRPAGEPRPLPVGGVSTITELADPRPGHGH